MNKLEMSTNDVMDMSDMNGPDTSWASVIPDEKKHICSGYKTCEMKCSNKEPHDYNTACEGWCLGENSRKYRKCRHVFKKEEVMFRLTGKI